MHELTITIPPHLWREFKEVAQRLGVTYESLATACIQRQICPDMGQPLMDVFANGGDGDSNRMA